VYEKRRTFKENIRFLSSPELTNKVYSHFKNMITKAKKIETILEMHFKRFVFGSKA
jgi:hypothetical protein